MVGAKIFSLLSLALCCCMCIKFPLKSGQVGNRMVTMDSDGNRVKLVCVNWYGAHMEDMVVNGLDRQPIQKIAAIIKELGFNCVRLPWALDTFFENPIVRPERLSANPELVGGTAMELLDAAVNALSDQEIIVIPNNHVSTAQWCCHPEDGLWYTDKYPEEDFFNAWINITERYRSNPWVAGLDLRNEIRPNEHGQWADWGNGEENDWAIAATKLGNMLLEVNPDALIIVEGILSAGNLLGAFEHPIQLSKQSQLVYSGHIYPFSPIISDLPYTLFKSTLQAMQTYVADVGTGYNYSAPYWMGEMGCGGDSENWEKIVRFLNETDHDWGYWSIDGYKYPGEGEGYGLLEDDYETIRHEWKIQQLQSLMPILSNHTEEH